MIPQHKLYLHENQYHQEPYYGLLYIQEPASTDYLQTVYNANSEANWGRWYWNSTDLQLNFNIYTTTWEISAIWLA